MTKVAVITDTHWGARNDSQAFAQYFIKFYDEVFFPTLDERGIQHVLHLGDLTDRRKYINFVTAKNLETHLMKPLYDRNIRLDVVAGNHDTFYKNTNEINSIVQLYGTSKYDNVNIIWDNAYEVELDDSCTVMMVPWICPENIEVITESLNKTKSQVVMGHFEIQGYEMMKGHVCAHGLDKKFFSKFDSVYSGHFHHPSNNDNITYLGAPYEMNWSDYQGRRGFHIFDTETREMEFIQNPFQMFHKILYDDSDMTIEDVSNLDISNLTNTFIKVIVKRKENPYIFDLFLDRLTSSSATDIKVVEDHMNFDSIDESELVDEAQDTMTILKQYVSSMKFNGNKDKIEDVLQELYNEAINL
jgi:predicted phosphodiesterase